jgi:hypothetical protein
VGYGNAPITSQPGAAHSTRARLTLFPDDRERDAPSTVVQCARNIPLPRLRVEPRSHLPPQRMGSGFSFLRVHLDCGSGARADYLAYGAVAEVLQIGYDRPRSEAKARNAA